MLVSYLEGVGRLSGGCGETVWRGWGGCLDDLGKLSGCVGRLYGGCREAV